MQKTQAMQVWSLGWADLLEQEMATCSSIIFFFFNLFIFNWRVIALQYCVGFCQTSTWISHRSTYVPSLLSLSRTSSPHPTLLGCYRAPLWVPWVIQQIPIGSLFYIRKCMFQYCSLLTSHPFLPPHLVPGKSYRQRNLLGYNLWDCQESDTIAHMHTV